MNGEKYTMRYWGVLVALFAAYWGCVAAQSVKDYGHLTSLVFGCSVVGICIFFREWRPVLLVSAYYVPLTALNIPSPFVILFGLVTCSALFDKSREERLYYKPFVFYLVLCVLLAVSSFYTVHQSPTSLLVIYARAAVFLALMLWFVRSRMDVLRLLAGVSIFCALSLFIAYAHYHLGQSTTNLGGKVLSSMKHGAEVGKITLGNLDDTRRVMWLGLEPNFHGLALVIGFSCSLIMWDLNYKKTGTIFLLCSLFSIVAVLGTYSRSTFLICCVFPILYFLLIRKLPIKFILCLAIPGAVYVVRNVTVLERLFSIRENLVETGGSGRIHANMSGIVKWLDRPLGVGIGGQETYLESERFGMVGTSHSTYVDLLVQLGIQGGIVLVLFFLSAYQPLMKNLRGARGVKEKNFYIGMCVMLFVAILFVGTIPLNNFVILFVVVVACSQFNVEKGVK